MFFDREEGGDKAILVHVEFSSQHDAEDLDEFISLALSAGADITSVMRAQRRSPVAKTLLGSGKVEELAALVEEHQADITIFNYSLSPSQERNLEKILQCRVLDRTGLILDIFSQRARSHEGKLQVELAQLQHISTRLIRGWTHLERQQGGIGMRGPGETQLETDRRLLRARVKSLLAKLEKVQKQREQGRRSRKKAAIPTVSIVGYTNAGKSTLFNRLTDADVYVADQLFATLDPTLRRIDVVDTGPVVLADTVGFVRHLPHKLVEAFKSTLEETVLADLLIHVVDCVSDERDDNMREVDGVLAEIGAEKLPQLLVYNKIDLLDDVQPHIDYDEQGRPLRVWLSAANNQGIDLLMQALSQLLGRQHWHRTLRLSPAQGQLRAQLFALNAVQDEIIDDEGYSILDIRISIVDMKQLEKKMSVTLQHFIIT